MSRRRMGKAGRAEAPLRLYANPLFDCRDRPGPPPCIARIEAQMARGGLAPAEGIRRLLAAHGAVQRRVLAHLVAAYACGVSIWAALDLARAPHAEAHDLAEVIRAMRRRYAVVCAAPLGFHGRRPECGI